MASAIASGSVTYQYLTITTPSQNHHGSRLMQCPFNHQPCGKQDEQAEGHCVDRGEKQNHDDRIAPHGKSSLDIGGRAMRRPRAEVDGASEAESHPAYEVLTDWTRAVWEKDVYGHHARFHDDRHGNQWGPHPPSARRQRATSASAAWQPVDTRLLACRRAAARAAL